MNDFSVAKYLETDRALIADSSSSARARLVAGLVQLGVKRANIMATGSFDEARDSIQKDNPRLVLCDFTVGSRPGLELLQGQRLGQADGKRSVFIMVTANAAQSAVARAAEEEVDCFILKPYTQDLFQRSLGSAVELKLNPNAYLKTIDAGRTDLSNARIEEAIAHFESAMALSPQPTLACYYLGQADLMRDSVSRATEQFQKGLSYSRIHYKCLVGLYDALTQQKKLPDSYDVAKRITQYFPANPQRLESVLRLAIVTHNYDDIEAYYRVFLQFDSRADSLVTIMCAALSVTGKHYLRQKANRRALEVFDRAVSCAGSKVRFIRYAIECLVSANLITDAQLLLKRFPEATRPGADYQVSEFLLMGKHAQSGRVMQKGRELLQAGHLYAAIYIVLIEHALKTGQASLARQWLDFALPKWPDQAEDLQKAYDLHLNQAGELI